MTRAGRSNRPFREYPFWITEKHGVGGLVAAFLGHHGLVPVRIEGLAGRIDDLDARPSRMPVAAGASVACAPSSRAGPGFARAPCRAMPASKRIADGDQLLGEALDRELARIVDLALGALAVILEFGHRPQVAVPVLLRLGLGSRQASGRSVRGMAARLQAGCAGSCARAAGSSCPARSALGWSRSLYNALEDCGGFGAARGAMSTGGYLRAFKAEPSSFAVTSTIGITRS